MLDEEILERLVDNLDNMSFTVKDNSFVSKSMWGYEFKNYEHPTIVVNIEDHKPGVSGMSNLHSYNKTTGVYTFSQEMIADVEIRISSRAKRQGGTVIHQRYITGKLLKKIKNRVFALNGGWGEILRDANGSVIPSSIQREKDLSDFDQADNNSLVMMTFMIRYEEQWNRFLEDSEPDAASIVTQVNVQVSDGTGVNDDLLVIKPEE